MKVDSDGKSVIRDEQVLAFTDFRLTLKLVSFKLKLTHSDLVSTPVGHFQNLAT